MRLEISKHCDDNHNTLQDLHNCGFILICRQDKQDGSILSLLAAFEHIDAARGYVTWLEQYYSQGQDNWFIQFPNGNQIKRSERALWEDKGAFFRLCAE